MLTQTEIKLNLSYAYLMFNQATTKTEKAHWSYQIRRYRDMVK